MAASKKHKLIHLAKELQLTVSHVSDYLEKEGFEVPSRPTATLTEEMYVTILAKYSPELHAEYMEAQAPRPTEAKPAGPDIRREAVEDILRTQAEEAAAEAAPEDEKVESEALKRLKELKVIEQPAPEVVEEPAEEPASEPEAIETVVEAEPEPVVEAVPAEAPAPEAEPVAEEAPDEVTTAAVVTEAPEAEAQPEAVAPEATATEAEPAEGPAPGRAIVEHADQDSEKIGLPVFRPGRVLGIHKDPEPEKVVRPKRKRKPDEPEAPATEGFKERDPMQASATTESDASRRKRSGKKTKSEELRLQKLEKAKDERSDLAGGRKRKKSKKHKFSEDEIRAAVKETTRAMDSTKKKRRSRKVKGVGEINEESNILRVTEFITTNELAGLLEIQVSDLIKKAFMMGTMVTINQRLERELIEILCDDYDYQVEFMSEFDEAEEIEEEVIEGELVSRAPVVTVMGHVDHGKTSVLDYLRNANVVSGEAGGITQHIGAYEVEHEGQKITFLDTPGHHSFTAMRARGAQVTDIVVLVVAADDRVQEQTKEAIDHAKAAHVPIVIAVNKIDKPNADPQRIRKELADYNILVEDWGGEYQCVDISAKKGENMDKLLAEILIRAEVLELQAVAEGPAKAVVIDSRLDKGRGTIATVLVQRGTLNKGDIVVAGTASGRVRLMLDERDNPRDTAPPSTPVQLLGLDSVPQAGDTLLVYETEKEARGVALKRQQIQREQSQQRISSFSLTQLSQQIALGEVRDLPIIIKGDVDGSIGAIADELMKMQTNEVRVNVISRSVGNITESDVLLAKASGAIIIGFHVTPTQSARELAQRERVDVRLYKVIYEVVEEIHAALEGMLAPDVEEEIVGTAEVRQVFRIAKKAIAGCMVLSGKIERNSKARLVRENEVVHQGELSNLKRFKEDVREVLQGFECGIQLAGYNDLREGDLIQVFTLKEVTRRLDLEG